MDAAFTLDSGIPREYESSFLEIGFTGDALHLGIAESTRVRKDGKRVALQPLRGEHIDLNKMKAPALLLGGFVARQRRTRRSWESGGYASGVQKITARRFHGEFSRLIRTLSQGISLSWNDGVAGRLTRNTGRKSQVENEAET